jgi:hypothetical protein
MFEWSITFMRPLLSDRLCNSNSAQVVTPAVVQGAGVAAKAAKAERGFH